MAHKIDMRTVMFPFADLFDTLGLTAFGVFLVLSLGMLFVGLHDAVCRALESILDWWSSLRAARRAKIYGEIK